MSYYTRVLSKDEEFPAYDELAEWVRTEHPLYRLTVEEGDEEWETLLLTSIDGDTYVIRAGPTHEVIATNAIGEPVYASLAVSQGRILVRGASHLFCIVAPKA